MNIILINHYAGSKYHGMEYRPYYIAREWVKAGHNVTIIGSSESHLRSKPIETNGGMREEVIDGINYLWLKTLPYTGNGISRIKNIFSFLYQLYAHKKYIVSKYKPDVVIASSTYPLDIYPASAIARKAKAKLIFEVHDLWPLSPIELLGYSPYHPFMVTLQLAENYAYSHSYKVVSLLPKTKDHMVAHGLSPSKFIYVPNGIDTSEWSGNTEKIPSGYAGIFRELKEKGDFIIGYAGYHGVANALNYLVDAAAILREERISVVMVGNGPYKQDLQAQAKMLGVENIIFMDAVPKGAVPDLLSYMDALCIGWHKKPIYRFGINPNKLIDYMMASKPVIHAVEAGNDPVAESGCGISIPPEDPQALAEAILTMSRLPESKRIKTGEKGKEYVLQNNDYRVLAEKFLGAFR